MDDWLSLLPYFILNVLTATIGELLSAARLAYMAERGSRKRRQGSWRRPSRHLTLPKAQGAIAQNVSNAQAAPCVASAIIRAKAHHQRAKRKEVSPFTSAGVRSPLHSH